MVVGRTRLGAKTASAAPAKGAVEAGSGKKFLSKDYLI
jgi:hypothetical protein